MVDLQARVVRKLTWRILPFVMLLYFVSFLDRVNVGFAALSMNKAIGLTPTMFGFGGGHLLPRLFPVRGSFESDPEQSRCAHLDRAGDDHVGPRVGGFRVCHRLHVVLCAALPARRGRSGLLSRHHPLSQPVVPCAAARGRSGRVHGCCAVVECNRLADLRRADGTADHGRSRELAMALHHRSGSGGPAGLRRAEGNDRQARASAVAREGRTGLAGRHVA